MLKGKCLLLQTVLIFPSANRALTLKFLHATCGWQFWLRPAGALCIWVFGENVEPYQCPNRLLRYLKNQGPNGGCSEHMLLSVEASGPSIGGSWANASLSVFLPQSSEEWAQETGGWLSPPHAFPHTEGLCVYAGHGLLSGDFQVTQVGAKVWPLHTDLQLVWGKATCNEQMLWSQQSCLPFRESLVTIENPQREGRI